MVASTRPDDVPSPTGPDAPRGDGTPRGTADAGLPVDPADLSEASRRMLEAALDAFAEQGYHATTTRDIAARARLSPAALYVHYPSKAALLAQISLFGHRSALDLLTSAAASTTDPVGRLEAAVARFVRWHAEHHRTARVVQYELSALPEEARGEVLELRHRISHLIEDVIRDGVAAGVMDVAEPRRVARAVLSLSVDVARWYSPGGPDTPADIGALYAALARRMVGASTPTTPIGDHQTE